MKTEREKKLEDALNAILFELITVPSIRGEGQPQCFGITYSIQLANEALKP